MAILDFTTTIIQDGVERSAPEVKAEAKLLAEKLVAFRHTRLGVATFRSDVLIAALLACEAARCELLLLREALSPSSVMWARWGVDAVLADSFEVTPTGAQGPSQTVFAVLLTTAGTTGAPKVARHSPACLLGRVHAPRSGQPLPDWLLTYHPASFAGVQVLLTALAGGGRLVATIGKDAATLAHAAVENRVTHISGTPTLWRAFLVALGNKAGGLPLRQITLGGEAVDQAILDRLATLFPKASISHIYASTEAGALFSVHDRRIGFPSRWLGEPVEGVELRIREGVLEVRSPRAMEAYLEGTSSAAQAKDGWLVTNDLVEERGDRIVFLGRADSVINVGGAKVSPDEIEAVLLEVEGVLETRVSGATNPITGQIVVAEIVLSPGYSDQVVRRTIVEYTRRRLPSYKLPRVIRFVGAIPYSSAGKKSRRS
jgi:acyl-CoA synthetase (AMP-forming)/AMP-acid ligase II